MRTRLLNLLGITSLMLVSSAFAHDHNYPQKQITLIVPFSAGGSTDVIARILARHMQEDFGQPVIVENRSGAGGGIGSAMVAKAAKDGYTLLVATGGSHVTAPLTAATKSFDPDSDFMPISLIATVPNLLFVHKSVPVNSVSELITYLKANPDKISFGSAGTGTGSHLGLEIFQKLTNTRMTHVAFRSTGDNANSLLGGHVQLAMDIIAVMLPQTQQNDGTLRALAVTSRTRSEAAPQIPPTSDTIRDFEIISWIGMFAPSETPQVIVDKLNAELKGILANPEVIESFKKLASTSSYTTPADFSAFLVKERALWEPAFKVSASRAQIDARVNPDIYHA
jgi:tripartite-type tricarboxylate transporter receptor subunit TctC